MTDTLHKNTESRTGYPTPETDAEHERICEAFCHGSNDYYKMFEFAKKLERERDAYKNALIEIDKFVDDDCSDFAWDSIYFALDSIQALTHNILNE